MKKEVHTLEKRFFNMNKPKNKNPPICPAGVITAVLTPVVTQQNTPVGNTGSIIQPVLECANTQMIE